jgi:hypothetical protein
MLKAIQSSNSKKIEREATRGVQGQEAQSERTERSVAVTPAGTASYRDSSLASRR